MPRSPGNVPASRSALSCGVIAWFVSLICSPPLLRWRRILSARISGPGPGAGYDRRSMAERRHQADAGLLARSPSGALVIGGITSVQFGAAIAATLFDTVGPAGTALLR